MRKLYDKRISSAVDCSCVCQFWRIHYGDFRRENVIRIPDGNHDERKIDSAAVEAVYSIPAGIRW